MKKVDHPNILKLYEVYEDDDYFFLVLELYVCQKSQEQQWGKGRGERRKQPRVVEVHLQAFVQGGRVGTV